VSSWILPSMVDGWVEKTTIMVTPKKKKTGKYGG
jgi:hypothetical protein